MTLNRLQHFNGASIQINVDGLPALGILFFLTADNVQITSLCFLKAAGQCPLVRHDLTPAEIEGIIPVSRNELKSAIAVHSTPEALGSQEQGRGQGNDLAALQKRMQAAQGKSRREIARSVELRGAARRSVQACAEVQQSIKACQQAIQKGRRERAAKNREGRE